jgi:hypothetical protein
MLVGAALIGRWCVGLLLIVGCLLVGLDALLRDSGTATGRKVTSTHEDVLERWRQAR